MPCTQRLLYLIHFLNALCSSVQDVFPSDWIFRVVTCHMVTMNSPGPFNPKRSSGRVSKVNDLLPLALFLLQQSRNILVTSVLMHSIISGGETVPFLAMSFVSIFLLFIPCVFGGASSRYHNIRSICWKLVPPDTFKGWILCFVLWCSPLSWNSFLCIPEWKAFHLLDNCEPSTVLSSSSH